MVRWRRAESQALRSCIAGESHGSGWSKPMAYPKLAPTDTNLSIAGAVHSATLGSVLRWTKSASRRNGTKQEGCGGVSGRSG
jgi:hypothetical protein